MTPLPAVPGGYSEATKYPQWKAAMDSEIEALRQTKTWTLVSPKEGMNILMCKWVFKQKMNEAGEVDRFKARSVANSMRQVEGIDVTATFALVVKPVSVILILSFAVTWGWDLKQYNIANAFLHEVLKEDVFMRQTLGYKDQMNPNSMQALVVNLGSAPIAKSLVSSTAQFHHLDWVHGIKVRSILVLLFE